MQRWVGHGVIADNVINVGLAIGRQSEADPKRFGNGLTSHIKVLADRVA